MRHKFQRILEADNRLLDAFAAGEATAADAPFIQPEATEKAHLLWRRRQALKGSVAETYLREARGIACPFSSTLGFLAERNEHRPRCSPFLGSPKSPNPGPSESTPERSRACI